MKLVPVKALAGFNYIRPDAVIAIGSTDASKCTVYMQGGVAIPGAEPAKDVIARLEEADAESKTETK